MNTEVCHTHTSPPPTHTHTHTHLHTWSHAPFLQSLSVQLYVISPLTCLSKPSSLPCLPQLCFFGLNPITASEGRRERGRQRQRGKEKDGKCGRKQEKAANECFIICREMEPFSLEIRREHKCLFSPFHTQSRGSRFLSVSLSLSCMWVLV